MPMHRGTTSIITDILGNILNKEVSVKVTFQLPRKSIEHECKVCDDGLSSPSDGLLGVDFLNNKLCIGTADSTPQVKVGTIGTLEIEENGPVESHTLALGLVRKPTGDMRNDLSLSTRSGEINIASISDNSPKERNDNQTLGIAAAYDKGRRYAFLSAGKVNNLKGPSLVRLQNQVYTPPFHGCDFDVPVDIRNFMGV
ncbi:hypothetical protein JTB14_010968 [Gonioctena quinquepunctata]|nr:hypothetical protein JTB14_010968 [Gonioctena quinquepunctata]